MAAQEAQALTVADVADAMERIAPVGLAQSWDNVGLLIGRTSATVSHALLCIDLTPEVLAESQDSNIQFILAYHPPLFRPITRVLADSTNTDAIVHDAIAQGMAVYSPHTALDAALGGTNDVLADLCGLRNVEPFEHVSSGSSPFKLVTFVPSEQLDMVASALFAAGAGRIGEYEQCSYRLQGEGTFFGTEGTDPQVGQKGRLERVAETRIETVVSPSALPGVIASLRRAHPYEEPAFDVYPLASEPTAGIGRVGTLPDGTTLGSLARSLIKATGSQVCSVIGDADKPLKRAAVCVGAAGRLPLERPASADCDVIVTGEIRHHDALTIQRCGKTAIALGHWESERPVLQPLAERLAAECQGRLRTTVSERDAGPFSRI